MCVNIRTCLLNKSTLSNEECGYAPNVEKHQMSKNIQKDTFLKVIEIE